MAPTSNAATACAVCAVQKITTGPSAGNSCSASSPDSSGIWMSSSTDVDAARAHALQHLVRVGALARDRDVGHRRQQPNQALARDRLVVGDQHAQRVRSPSAPLTWAIPPACVAIGNVTSATRGVARRGDRQHRLAIIGERQPALDDVDAAAARAAAPVRARVAAIDTTSWWSASVRTSRTMSPPWPAAGPCLTAFSASGSSNIGGT